MLESCGRLGGPRERYGSADQPRIDSDRLSVDPLGPRPAHPPSDVLDEVARPYKGRQAFLKETGLRGLIEVQRPGTRSGTDPASGWEVLDEGEQDAIALARELKVPLLIEERAGRRVARKLGCNVSGIAGLIDRAREERLLSPAEAKQMWRILLEENRIPKSLYQSLVHGE